MIIVQVSLLRPPYMDDSSKQAVFIPVSLIGIVVSSNIYKWVLLNIPSLIDQTSNN